MDLISLKNKKGVTLIELLVALIICGIIIAGIYRVFIAQTRAYSVQDQVVEVQQNVRSAMEILLRDLRMSGYDRDEKPTAVAVPSPPIQPNFNGDNSIRIFYQYNELGVERLRQVEYWRNNSILYRKQVSVPAAPSDTPVNEQELLRDVIDQNGTPAFRLTYGVDGREGLSDTQDGSIDNTSGDGAVDAFDFIDGATVIGIGTSSNPERKVIAVRVALAGSPDPANSTFDNVTARTLSSIVTVRNRCLVK